MNNPNRNGTCNESNDNRYACTFYKVKAGNISDEQAEEHRKVYVHLNAFDAVFAEAKDEDQWQQ